MNTPQLHPSGRPYAGEQHNRDEQPVPGSEASAPGTAAGQEPEPETTADTVDHDTGSEVSAADDEYEPL